MDNNEKIDFVVLWVDGSDPDWLKEKLEYQGIENVDTTDLQNHISRYRDMGLMKYWFRSIEKFAPWVNNIYFITWGHLPDFLNVDNHKLRIVNHKGYIPSEYLPTFNSNVIELNLHRIKSISEQFVLFNDDMFLTNNVSKEDFFKNGLPRGYAILSPTIPINKFEHNVINNVMLLNKSFRLNEVFKKYGKKFYCTKYGKDILRTVFLKQWGSFCGFKESHCPHAYLKSSFDECYKLYKESFDETSTHRFRELTDITHWLVEYWQYLSGKFEPISPKVSQLFDLSDDNKVIVDSIKNKKYKMICVNDGNPNYDFEKAKEEMIEAFETILPEKSSFEK